MKYLLLIAKNLRRNRTRSLLTAAGTMILVLVVSLVWSILSFLDEATTEKNANFKAIVTERWRIPSQMPFAYAESLSDGAARRPGDVRPSDSMTWQFYGGTLDPTNRTRDNSLFAFAMQPSKIATMMDEFDTLPHDSEAYRQLVDVTGSLIATAAACCSGGTGWRPSASRSATGSSCSASTIRTSTWNSRLSACCRSAGMTTARFSTAST